MWQNMYHASFKLFIFKSFRVYCAIYTSLCRKHQHIWKRETQYPYNIISYIWDKKNTSTGLMGCMYHELRALSALCLSKQICWKYENTTSHQLTPAKQTWPSGCWHYCKPTAPPKHAFSYVTILYKVCNETIKHWIFTTQDIQTKHTTLWICPWQSEV